MASATWIFWFIALPPLVIGLWLIKRGQWPRRIGTTPHCRKCCYILTGLETDRCPECGSIVIPHGVVHGERPRRPALTWIGAILTMIGLALVVLIASGALSRVNWNQYKPLSWLLKQVDSPVPAESTAAWVEITRRIKGNLLSDPQQNLLVERGLVAQQSTSNNAYNAMLFEFIGKRFVDHKLSASQEQRFFDNALKAILQVRPIVGSKDPIPYWIYGRGRGPDGWWTRESIIEWQVDDRPIQKGGGSTSSGGSFSGWGSGSTIPAQPPGKHHLRAKLELSTSAKTYGAGASEGPFDKTVIRDLEADFTSVEGHVPITTIASPSPDVLRPLFKVRLSVSATYLNCNVDCSAPPVDTAFDCFIVFNGKEYPCSSVNFHKGTNGGYGSGTMNFPKPMPPKVDFLLRSSETVARGTIDMTQIWKGELLFHDVPVQNAQRPATSAP